MTSLDKSSKIAALTFWSCDDKHCQIHENRLPLSSLRKNKHHAIQRKKIKTSFFSYLWWFKFLSFNTVVFFLFPKNKPNILNIFSTCQNVSDLTTNILSQEVSVH